jgi:3-oxoacyl-[acyl-carrier protein] reductase
MSIALSLSDKVALISGGSRGIGAATVRMFTAAGAKVVFNYRSARARAESLAKECGTEVCRPVACNLDNSEAARSLIAETVRQFGRLDILVANHGVWPPEDVAIERITDEHWRSTMSINLDGVFGLVKHAVAQMKSQARRNSVAGHIVLISSTSGQRGEAFHVDYSATKGAIISMTKSLSSELAPQGIYVNCVAPGWVDTDMSAATLAEPKTGEVIRRTIPLGRVGTPAEIAAPILFLCTEHAGFISGEIFNVNGGAVLIG